MMAPILSWTRGGPSPPSLRRSIAHAARVRGAPRRVYPVDRRLAPACSAAPDLSAATGRFAKTPAPPPPRAARPDKPPLSIIGDPQRQLELRTARKYFAAVLQSVDCRLEFLGSKLRLRQVEII